MCVGEGVCVCEEGGGGGVGMFTSTCTSIHVCAMCAFVCVPTMYIILYSTVAACVCVCVCVRVCVRVCHCRAANSHAFCVRHTHLDTISLSHALLPRSHALSKQYILRI